MTKEGSTKILNFITHGVGVLMLGRGHIRHYSEYALSSTFIIQAAVKWLKYCRYGLKHYHINQSINIQVAIAL